MADANTKATSWPMIIGIVFVTCLVLTLAIGFVASMLGMSSRTATAGGAAGAGVVAAILITRRRAALGGSLR